MEIPKESNIGTRDTFLWQHKPESTEDSCVCVTIFCLFRYRHYFCLYQYLFQHLTGKTENTQNMSIQSKHDTGTRLQRFNKQLKS